MKNPLTKRTRNAFDPYEKRWFELVSVYVFGIYITTFSQPKEI